jgi:outer membrane protein TolC
VKKQVYALGLMASLWAAGGRADEAGDMAPLRLTFVESLDIAFENSQWRSVSRLEVEIAAAQHRQALSTYWPQVVGIGMEIPVFDGYLTRHRIREARIRVEKLESQKVLLRQGLALQVKAFFIELLNAQNQEAAAAALDAATDNLRLNERAYQNELVEIQDLIEAQLLAAFSEAVYHKIRYDHLVSKPQLELVIGTEIKRLVQ